LPIQKLSPNFEAAVGIEANNYQYNGIELVEDFGLHINHAQFRSLDPQTGRWWQIDPMAEKFYAWSPYNSNLNNPVRYDDPKGDCPLCPVAPIIIGGLIGFGVDLSFQVGKNIYEGGLQNAFSRFDFKSAAISATAGALGGFAAINITSMGVPAVEAITANVMANTGIGMVESTTKQIGSTNTLDGTKVLRDGFISGATAGYGDSAGHLLNKFSGESAEDLVPSTLLNSATETMENTFQNIADSGSGQRQKEGSNNQRQVNSNPQGSKAQNRVTSSPYNNQSKFTPRLLEANPFQ